MLKDDTKDQIPLFDLPLPDSTKAQGPSGGKTKGRTTAEKTSPTAGLRVRKSATSAPEARGATKKAPKTAATKGGRSMKPAAGPVPEGDVRLTANIREDLHLKLKIVAATRRTTIGELIEDLVQRHL